jgi:hypothetical protein
MDKMFQTFGGSYCLQLLDPDGEDTMILQKVGYCLPVVTA